MRRTFGVLKLGWMWRPPAAQTTRELDRPLFARIAALTLSWVRGQVFPSRVIF